MSISTTGKLCERCLMTAANHGSRAWPVALLVFGVCFNVTAQSTNSPDNVPARVESASQSFEESAFRIVTERNIFNANRSGGQVRGPSRRPTTVEYFALVGTMDYEKGIFAFFDGSSSQLTKVMKANDVIAGHKLLSISANSVKLEADGKESELPVGSQMRREDEGAWQVSEAARGGLNTTSNGNGDSSSRGSRTDRGDSSLRSRREGDSSSRRSENSESTNRSSGSTATPSANEDEILKRLMERREKESQ